jgi:hypothetical protein
MRGDHLRLFSNVLTGFNGPALGGNLESTMAHDPLLSASGGNQLHAGSPGHDPLQEASGDNQLHAGSESEGIGAVSAEASCTPWPEDAHKAAIQQLEDSLSTVGHLPAPIGNAARHIVATGKILQDWVQERRSAYVELKDFKDQADHCTRQMGSPQPLSVDCKEIKPSAHWYCTRRAASERMRELDKQLQKTHRALAVAAQQAEEHEQAPQPSTLALGMKTGSIPSCVLIAGSFIPSLRTLSRTQSSCDRVRGQQWIKWTCFL